MWNHIADWLMGVGRDILQAGEVIFRSVLIIGAAVLAGRYASRLIVRNLSIKSFGRNGALMVGRLVSITLVVVGILILFGSLGANWTGLLTFVSASAVAISLSIQDVLKNLVAGIYLLLERPFRVGDQVRIRTVEGEIQGIDVRTTLVRDDAGELVMIPNTIVFTEILHNRSHYRVKRLEFAISQMTQSVHDIEQAVSDVLRDVPGVRHPIPAPRVTSSSPEGRTMTLALMVDNDPQRQTEIIERVLGVLNDAKVDVTQS
jgi:small conductance mechanosensitive channel